MYELTQECFPKEEQNKEEYLVHEIIRKYIDKPSFKKNSIIPSEVGIFGSDGQGLPEIHIAVKAKKITEEQFEDYEIDVVYNMHELAKDGKISTNTPPKVVNKAATMIDENVLYAKRMIEEVTK